MEIFIVAISLNTEKVNVKINQSLKESSLHVMRKAINIPSGKGILPKDDLYAKTLVNWKEIV